MNALHVDSITLHHYSIQLRIPFRISAGEITTKEDVVLAEPIIAGFYFVLALLVFIEVYFF